jgi:DNA-binding transcriptional LysR family regulator
LESTNEFRGKPAGTLRLTAPQPAADFFLASAIPCFLAQYPEISLDLSVSDTLTDIVVERFDVAYNYLTAATRAALIAAFESSGVMTPTRSSTENVMPPKLMCSSDSESV